MAISTISCEYYVANLAFFSVLLVICSADIFVEMMAARNHPSIRNTNISMNYSLKDRQTEDEGEKRREE